MAQGCATRVFNVASTEPRYLITVRPEPVERPSFLPVRQPKQDGASTGLGRTDGFGDRARTMIDNFSLAISHGLMLLAAWFLIKRPDLDAEASPHDDQPRAKRKRWGGKDA